MSHSMQTKWPRAGFKLAMLEGMVDRPNLKFVTMHEASSKVKGGLQDIIKPQTEVIVVMIAMATTETYAPLHFAQVKLRNQNWCRS